MTRPDILRLAKKGTDLGLMVVLGTNGVLLDDARIAALQQAGVKAAGISLDSLRPEHHDDFRGKPGAWAKTMAGIDACRRAGLMFQIHFSVTDDNADELADMIDFARSAGASVLNVFFLVCTGRGAAVSNISREVYERVLRRVAEAARDEEDLLVRARCAPHFKRMALQLDPPLPVTLVDGYEAGGCLAGTRYCRITPEGDVTPCPYMEVSVGSLRQRPFAEIWRDAPLLEQLRAPHLEGRCGSIIRGLAGRRRAGGRMPGRRLYSWRNGIGSLPQALARELGPAVRIGVAVRRIRRLPGGFRIDAGAAGTILLVKEALSAARRHFQKEEQVLFPMAQRLLGDEELTRLGNAWAEARRVRTEWLYLGGTCSRARQPCDHPCVCS